MKQLDLSLVYGSFRVNLLNMSDIMELNVFGTGIDSGIFNNDNDDIVYNNDTRYYFQNNPICNQLPEGGEGEDEDSEGKCIIKIACILKDTDACIDNDYCDFSSNEEEEEDEVNNNLCQPKLWNNNICDKERNLKTCSYDAGDCH